MALNIFNYLTFLLCVGAIVHGQHTPTITYINPPQIQNPGDKLDLICAVEHAEEFPVQWVKKENLESNDSVPLTYNSTLLIRDLRFSTRFDASQSAYYLSIKDLEESDAGWYQCQVFKTVDDVIKADVELNIRTPPVFLRNTTRSLLTVAGENAELECYATGYPAPNIYWRRENNVPLPTGAAIYRGNVLKFTPIKHTDFGTYYCVAENGVGKEIRRAMDLHVEFSPKVFGLQPRKQQALNTSAYLSCEVQAYPPPAITWFKEGVQLPFNGRYRISNFGTSDETTVTTLNLANIDNLDYGNYTCKAKNKLGAEEADLQLYELVFSACPPDCKENDSKTTASTDSTS